MDIDRGELFGTGGARFLAHLGDEFRVRIAPDSLRRVTVALASNVDVIVFSFLPCHATVEAMPCVPIAKFHEPECCRKCTVSAADSGTCAVATVDIDTRDHGYAANGTAGPSSPAGRGTGD